MEPRIVREPATVPKNRNDIEISEQIVNALQMAEPTQWDSFFESLRLNAQSRIAGCTNDRELVKTQARVEYIEELYTLWKKMIGKGTAPARFT